MSLHNKLNDNHEALVSDPSLLWQVQTTADIPYRMWEGPYEYAVVRVFKESC